MGRIDLRLWTRIGAMNLGGVAQTSSLPYRRFPTCEPPSGPSAPEDRKARRLEVGDTAGWKPALRAGSWGSTGRNRGGSPTDSRFAAPTAAGGAGHPGVTRTAPTRAVRRPLPSSQWTVLTLSTLLVAACGQASSAATQYILFNRAPGQGMYQGNPESLGRRQFEEVLARFPNRPGAPVQTGVSHVFSCFRTPPATTVKALDSPMGCSRAARPTSASPVPEWRMPHQHRFRDAEATRSGNARDCRGPGDREARVQRLP